MAFSFSNAASSPSNPGGVNVKDGPELLEIRTTELAFHTLNGEVKLQLLPAAWPADHLPPPSASLLSVASSRKLLAAAGPDALYVSNTSAVRDAFQAIQGEKLRPFKSDIKIPIERLCQVVFSSDDSVLVVSTEKDGGILAFQVNNLQNDQPKPALNISTNGQQLKALVSNPVHESAQLFAAVTQNGHLHVADLKTGSLVVGSNGTTLLENVSTVTWSNKGKQLMAGLLDGTAVQLKPDGTIVSRIPKSTSIANNLHVSGISWLENDTFFFAYTPNSEDTSDGIPASEYYIITRDSKTASFTFERLPEVVAPFGLERVPSSHLISRLRGWQPHLRDLLIVTATTSSDVGLVTKSVKPLSEDGVVDPRFTVTVIDEDTERPQLPLSANQEDTSPIGMAVDLSSTEKVPGPVKAEPEINETDGPVPNLLILNTDGVLVSFWVLYADSVREKTLFPGIGLAEEGVPHAPQARIGDQNNGTTKQQTVVTGFGKDTPSSLANSSQTNTEQLASGFAAQQGANDTFAKPSFGLPATQNNFSASSTNTFGAPTPGSFGTSSPITASTTSWASTGFGAPKTGEAGPSAFGKPSFGSSTAFGASSTPGFGTTSALGKPSFNAPLAGAGGNPVFGQQSAFGTASTTSPFASASANPSKSGFGAFSKGGGFASFTGGKQDNSQSPFAKATGQSGFSQPSSSNTFSSTTSSASPFTFGKPAQNASTGFGATSFKIESSFKGDGTAKDDLPKPETSSSFGFGKSLDDVLGASKSLSPTHDHEAEMSEESDVDDSGSETVGQPTFQGFSPTTDTKPGQALSTPPATLNQSKATPAPPITNLFGNSVASSTTPQAQFTTPGWTFNPTSSTTPKETPGSTLFGTKTSNEDTPAAVAKSEPTSTLELVSDTPRIKEEPPSDDESVDLQKIPEAPLPPDTTSKPRYVSGDTSVSSLASRTATDDAPLPPDFLSGPRKAEEEEPAEGPPSGDEDLSSDFEDSGEEVTAEVGVDGDSSDDKQDGFQTSPESSFKGGDHSLDASPTGESYTKISTTLKSGASRPLFGEVGSGLGPAPRFPLPNPQESPRSPSPVRKPFPVDAFRVDPSRSVSAPTRPLSVIDQRKAEFRESGLATQAAKLREEEAAKERARREELMRRKAEADAAQFNPLQDDEDERLRQELDKPVVPTETLDEYITYQPQPPEDTSKTGIPAQIERLTSDINKMVTNFGINNRSLKAFLLYQQPDVSNPSWPQVLTSETPQDALHDEWLLGDIGRLYEGQTTLTEVLDKCQVDDFDNKLQDCQSLLVGDLYELRAKLTSLRKTLANASSQNNTNGAPLSAEQASVQADLRRASASVQSKLVQVEDSIAVLKARVTDLTGQQSFSRRSSLFGKAPSQKKPTVEAVTKTVSKMMSMAEQKSADIDLLESQLKKLGLGSMDASMGRNGSSTNGARHPTTPERSTRSVNGGTPGSSGSVYHTPGSNFGASARSSRFRSSQNGGVINVSAEDKERWQIQALRKKEAATILKGVLHLKSKNTQSRG